MNFTTVEFLSFVAVVTMAYHICPSRFRPGLLTVASYFYYCIWSSKGALLLFGVTVAAFVTAHAIESRKVGQVRRLVMLTSLSGLVVLLAGFKFAPLVPSILHGPFWIPLGISYYTFKLISYILDVYWGNIGAERSFIAFACYVAFFPQIVAGPIQRSDSFLPQIHRSPRANWTNIAWGLQRILLGFFKKLFIADALSIYVDFIYGHLHAPGTPLVVGLYLYPLQIYADFSGLSDIAIGTAWMFGIQTPENFNAPFWAPSPSEFWRRWHITLTSLLTDYVFTPLRMALRAFENVGLVFSLFVTMVLIGLWHGARWTYVFFGAIHGTYLAIDALTLRARKRFYKAHPASGRLMDWFGPLVTFHLVAAAFVFFRAETLSDALFVIRSIGSSFGMLSQEFSKLMVDSGRTLRIGLSAYAAVEFADYLRRNSHDGELVRRMPPLVRCLVYSGTTVAAVLMVLCLLGTQVKPSTFVYAMF